ncbi:hypothetical protein E2562_014090 [Oryza meyeriana var. granulata]|uniref:Uncharacterized protein n=1 Tax=Oryza meyeriana var. granulata TaxID=110450 RepID=A0A6G1DLA7_9ORYZ|nr:hypothetical protein E2562_014090 [Oryza meyeriana var. granulata]
MLTLYDPARAASSNLPSITAAMSHGGAGSSSGGQPSCASVSLGKYLRRAIRKRINGGKPKRRRPEQVRSASGGGEVRVSTELTISSSPLKSSEPVVRVVLQSGVVEAYAGVVLACTVIRNHPPGLCLAYPDVFRNPHGARVRPLEPLFPGQKFYLLPEDTMTRLQKKIPESSVGAFDDADDNKEEVHGDDASEDDATSTETTTTTEEEDTQDYSSGGASSSEEDPEAAAGDNDDECGTRSWCCAREYFEAKERWEECQFKQMVARGLAVEQSSEPDRKETAMKKKGKKNRKGKKKKKRNPGGVPWTGCRTSGAPATPGRTWEPSLPSVEEESSPLQPPSETTSCRG